MCVHPGIIPAVTRESRDTLTGGRSMCTCASRDNPGIVTVTRESRDTLTGGRSMCMCVHPGIGTVTRESRDTLTVGLEYVYMCIPG